MTFLRRRDHNTTNTNDRKRALDHQRVMDLIVLVYIPEGTVEK